MTTLRMVLEGIGGALQIAGLALLQPVARGWYRTWGATPTEAQERLPGDEIVPRPRSEVTLAVSVAAPPECLWPWLAQLGCQRGGWYSYDLLDNGGQPSAERVLTEHQHLALGDIVRAVPKGDFGFPVARLHRGQLLCLGGVLDTSTGKSVDLDGPPPASYFAGSQVFVLLHEGERGTRLLFRNRVDFAPVNWPSRLGYGVVLEVVTFVMARKMLLNLKRRAEVLAHEAQPA
jgi:proline iminopeptidase